MSERLPELVSDEQTLRFGGLSRLYGHDVLARLAVARVCVVGIGGVGSWAVESLARSGIGHLTLIDLDDVCITNTNRQLHALTAHIGQPKVKAMAERVRLITPDCQVEEVADFFTAANADRHLRDYDLVLDCIDSVSAKCVLIHAAMQRKLPVITSGGAGGKRDSTQVRCDDLAFTHNDSLLKQVRRELRYDHGWDIHDMAPCGVRAVFSPEPPLYPWSDGRLCPKPERGGPLRLDCASGFGTASFVTGAFGLAMAGEAVRMLMAVKSG